MKRIYVSSSYQDLRTYRRHVAAKVRELGHVAIGMEADGAQERQPLDVCLSDVRSCDAYIGIIGFRYGSSPPGLSSSFTENEYEAAAATGMRMIFIATSEATELDPPYRDTDPTQIAKLNAFRQRLQQHSVALVSSVAELVDAVEKAILQNLGTGTPIPPLLPYLCDRQDQEAALADALHDRLPTRPIVFVVHGDRREAQRRFVERLRKITLPRLLHLPQTETVCEYRLTWPETRTDRTQMARWLTRELERVVAGEAARAPLAEVFRQMTATRMPTLVSAVVDDPRWGDEEMKAVAAFLRFWETAPDYESVQPLVVCLAISYPATNDDAGWRSFFRRRPSPATAFEAMATPAPPRITLTVPARLGRDTVSRQHVNTWLDREVRPLAERLRLKEACLEQRIDEFFTKQERTHGSHLVPMAPLAEELERALQACRRAIPEGELFE